MNERDLQSQAVTAWRSMGATALVLGHSRRQASCPNCGHRFADHRTQQAEGLFDLLLFWPQYRVIQGIEMKTRSGHLRPMQLALHAVAAEAGIATYVVRSMADVVTVARAAGVAVREEE